MLVPPKKIDDQQAGWESHSVMSAGVYRRGTEGSFKLKKDHIKKVEFRHSEMF